MVEKCFNHKGDCWKTDTPKSVPPIVEEVEQVIICIKKFDKAFYSQFGTKANNMSGFLGDNMRGVQNNNMINS